MAEAGRVLGSNMTREMRGLAAREEAWQLNSLTKRTGIPVGNEAFSAVSSAASWVRTSPELLAALVDKTPVFGKLLTSWTDGLAGAQLDRMSSALRIGVQQGESIAGLGRRIRRIEPWSRRSSEAVARTVVNGFSREARMSTMRQNKHLLKGIQIVATLDARTTPICRDLDGKVFPVDSGPRPPFHVACRTTIAPLVKSWKAIGSRRLPALTETRRRAMDGFVPRGETHNAWLLRQPVPIQEEILGVRRAEIFRTKKGIELSDLIDRQRNRYWTLEELGPKLARKVGKTSVQEIAPSSVLGKRLEIPEFKTAKQGRDWIEGRYAEKVELLGAKTARIQEIAEGLSRVLEGTGVRLKKIRFHPRSGDNYFGAHTPGDKTILLNRRFLKDPNAGVKRIQAALSQHPGGAKGTFVSSSSSRPVVAGTSHEAGHALWYDGLSEQARTTFAFETERFYGFTKRIDLGFSSYASTSAEELWAELIAMSAEGRISEIPADLLTSLLRALGDSGLV